MPLKVVRRSDTGALTISGTVKLPDGSRQRVRARAQSDRRQLAEEEAAALEARLLREAFHGEKRGSRSFANAVKSYLEFERRAAGDIARLRRVLLAIGDVPLSAVDQEMVDRARTRMLSPDASPATVRRGIIAPIRAVMMHAHRRGWCERPSFEIPKQPRGRTNFLLPAEAERLITAAAPHLQPLFVFLLGTGARMTEALELEWPAVDLVGARATFWRTKSGEPRVAALPPRIIQAFSPSEAGHVFLTHRGLPYADREREGGGQIKTAWKATLRRAGLRPELTPHDLRHTWASWHYAVNRDLLALKVEGGWSSVTLVERYAHLMPAGHEDGIRAFWHGGDTGRFAFEGKALIETR